MCSKHNIWTNDEETCEYAKNTNVNDSIKEPIVRGESTTSSSDFSTDNKLYAHQWEVIDFGVKSPEIALFWDPGVGKSAAILTIAALKYKQGLIDALLIIAPNTVHRQWYCDQIPLWLDVADYQCQCLFGNGGAKQAYPFKKGGLEVVVVNINTFSLPDKWKDIVAWALGKKTMVVLDEAQTIQNLTTKRTQNILYKFNDTVYNGKRIIKSVPKTVARAVLTGTPVANGSTDLYCIMEFLRPNFFGRNYYSFKHHYGMFTQIAVDDRVVDVPLTEEWWQTIKNISSYEEAKAVCGCSIDTFNTIHTQESFKGPYKNAEELKELLKPVSFFKRIEDCTSMPEKNYIVRYLDMSPEIKQCYNDMVHDYIASYDAHTMTALSKLVLNIRLQQISSGFISDKTISLSGNDLPLMYLEDCSDLEPSEIKWIGNTNPKLEQLYMDIEECSKPIVIATRYTAEASRIYDDLSKLYKCCLMTGWKLIGTIEEYQQGKYDIMVANTNVVAAGLNLQNGHTIMIYSNTFSLKNRIQLEGRIYRIGQSNTCFYYDYLYRKSIDEKIIKSLKLKQDLLDFIRGVNIESLIMSS